MATVSVVAFEAVLHLFPGVMGGYVANVAYTGDHWQGGGIYALDSHAGPILRPSVRRFMYWNGQPLSPSDPRRVWSERVALRMRCSGILGALVRSMRDPALRRRQGGARDPFRPTPEEIRTVLPGL